MAHGAAAPAEPVFVTVKANDFDNNKLLWPSNFIVTSKYTAVTFLFLNLFHQFRKVQNFYFLVNMIFALIPGVSPINPASSVLPLIFVVGVAMVKDGYEDYLRHQADNRANSIETEVVRKNPQSGAYELVTVESADVCVGDFIYIKNGEEVRADVLLLWTPAAEGAAFIDTCNLDGETNLKGRKGHECTLHLDTLEKISKCTLSVKTNQPSPNLHDWTGVVSIDGKEEAVGIDQFLYRSCLLKNTEHAWGMVLYAGVDTKMFRNLAEKPHKMSNLDAKMNVLIIVILCCQIIALIIMASYGLSWNKRNIDKWYLKDLIRQDGTGGKMWIFRYMSYFILMSYMIPISLFVTIELCKVGQGLLMGWDHEMFEWMYGKWVHCNPNTTDLNEQLAQVKFIFSDKTGTLTENKMTYKAGDVMGSPIHADDWGPSRELLHSDKRQEALRYFKALALCHTIQPFKDEKHPDHPTIRIYDGASPDEIALVKTAKEHNLILVERTTRKMEVLMEGTAQTFEILATLEFTPDRKMMSIIVREPDGKISLFTKGADSFVIPRLDAAACASTLPPLEKALAGMGSLGLRTLIVCGKTITQAQFDEWYKRFEAAGKELVDRAKKVDQICLEMEKDMELIGATAIEDKLQDKVPETLQFFLDAGVVVWMLTGDKRETAVTIAATSSLANPEADYIHHVDIGALKAHTDEARALVGRQLDEIDQLCDKKDKKVTFVIDGVALEVAMDHHAATFVRVSQRVNSAVCCRLTPLQKANVVDMFQTTTGSTALAIGDGANDVTMIQKGRVGVGIMGLEGAQAALAADYAIPRFKHLKRLCCVHGRYSQVRNSLCINFSFYKNMSIAMLQFYFCFYVGGSGTTLVDGWLLTFYNVAFTVMPPLMLGLFEKDVTERALMEQNALFPDLGDGMYFDGPTVGRWFAQAILHSLMLFYIMHPTQLRQDVHGHMVMDFYMYGTMITTALVCLVLVKLILHTRYWQSIQVGAQVFSFFIFAFILVVYAAIPNLFGQTFFYWNAYMMFQEPKYWFYTLFFVMGVLMPIDMAVIFVQRQLFPTIHDKMQEQYEFVKSK